MCAHKQYRHVATLDTDLFVHKVQFIGRTYFKVRGSLICRRTGYVYETGTFTIQRKDLPNWREVAGG